VDTSKQARQQRALLRSQRLTRVDPGTDVPLPPQGLARLELAFALSQAAWLLSGKPWPSIPRSELPIRVRSSGKRVHGSGE
jgi:hypothetical protein